MDLKPQPDEAGVAEMKRALEGVLGEPVSEGEAESVLAWLMGYQYLLRRLDARARAASEGGGEGPSGGSGKH